MFHHFHSETQPAYAAGSISAEELELIIRSVGRANVLDADEYIQRRADGTLLPHQTCITFDDGLKCQYDVALPVLLRHNIRAAWHIYTCVYEEENTPEDLEVYKYFQSRAFSNIDEFYAAFFEAAKKIRPPRARCMASAEAKATRLKHLSTQCLTENSAC